MLGIKQNRGYLRVGIKQNMADHKIGNKMFQLNSNPFNSATSQPADIRNNHQLSPSEPTNINVPDRQEEKSLSIKSMVKSSKKTLKNKNKTFI
jgi:hypothetical protein